MEDIKQQKEHFYTLKTSTRIAYSSINSVHCPILGEDIVFNSNGFRHLTIKPDGTYRTVKEGIYKLTLFPLAIPTIKSATVISDERDIKISVGRGKRRKYKDAKTYALTAYVGKKHPTLIRVIILRIGTGKYSFYSIMKN